jgi:carbamoyl-phosphate synthase large subunit
MRRVTRILISGAGPATFGILKGLRYSGEAFHCSVVEVNPLAAGNFVVDQFFLIDPVKENPQKYVSRLLDLSRREHVDLVIPTVSEELLPLAERREEFEARGIRLLVSDPAAVAACVDKWRTFEFCRGEKIPCPVTELVGSKRTVQQFVKSVGFPVSVKPRLGRGSTGFKILQSAHDIDTIASFSGLVVQKYIDGPEYSTDVLMEDGCPRVAVPRERVQTESGISVIGRTVRHREVSALAMRVCEALGLEGVANVQIKVHKNRPMLIEVNPRFAGTTILSVAAGINFPHLVVKNFLRGERLKKSELAFRQNIYLTRFWAEVFLEKKGARLRAFEPDSV